MMLICIITKKINSNFLIQIIYKFTAPIEIAKIMTFPNSFP